MPSPMSRSSSPLVRLIGALAVTTLFALVLTGTGTASAQPLCNGLVVTVDIGAGQVPTLNDDVILGTPGDDIIPASNGNDTICGGDGDDQLWGQDGDDTLIGGPGNDRLRGGDGNDTLLGGTGVDDINGGRDNDTIDAGDGDDSVVRGGTGDDMITGGPGDDVLISGNGGFDIVTGGDGDDQKVTGGPRPDTVRGGNGNDLIKGNKGADILEGGAGNDEIFGGPQPDTLDGGSGTDTCNGGTETDTTTACEVLINIEGGSPATSSSVGFLETYGGFLAPAGTPYATFATVTDETGTVQIEIPSTFGFVDVATNSGVPSITAEIVEGGGLDNPAITLRAFTANASDVNAILAENGPALIGDCSVLTSQIELPAPAGFEGLLYAEPITVGALSGAYVVYDGCVFGESPTSIIEIALGSTDNLVAILTFTVVTTADLAFIDRALSTLQLTP